MDAPRQVHRATIEPCKVDGCEQLGRAFGLCGTHYRRQRLGQDLNAPIQRQQTGPCSVDGCELPPLAHGLCTRHYNRKRRGRPLDEDTRRQLPAGATRPTEHGYVVEKVGTGRRWVLQHRLRMEERIGRPLRPEESVHHKNGKRDDNRLENLELWSSSHPSGQRVEDLVAWARELLELYA